MQELDKLPDKWYVIVENKETAAVYKEFFQRDWMYDVGYYYSWNGINYVSGSIPNGTLISFEQFKKWVLKQSEETLLEKAKRLYPIGTKYKCANNLRNEEFIVEDLNFRKFSNAIDFIGKGFIYHSGKWAEIVHEVKPVEKWSVGSYAVFLTANKHNYPKGTIDKIKKNTGDKALFEKYGNYMPANPSYQYNEEFKWFATLEEAEAFSKSLIPLTELQPPKKDHNPEYVKLVNMDFWKNGYRDLKLGTIYKWSHLTTGIIASLSSDYWDRWTKEFEISTKAEYDAQQLVSVSKPTEVKPSESKFEDMSKDELLEYARKKYPIGTKVKFPDYRERIISQELYWQYKNLISYYECCPILVIKDGEYVWAEIIEMPKLTPSQVMNIVEDITKDVLPGNNGQSFDILFPKKWEYGSDILLGSKDGNSFSTHQSINKRLKFLPIKVELIKVKKLKK